MEFCTLIIGYTNYGRAFPMNAALLIKYVGRAVIFSWVRYPIRQPIF